MRPRVSSSSASSVCSYWSPPGGDEEEEALEAEEVYALSRWNLRFIFRLTRGSAICVGGSMSAAEIDLGRGDRCVWSCGAVMGASGGVSEGMPPATAKSSRRS